MSNKDLKEATNLTKRCQRMIDFLDAMSYEVK